jgi:hypothetical protein
VFVVTEVRVDAPAPKVPAVDIDPAPKAPVTVAEVSVDAPFKAMVLDEPIVMGIDEVVPIRSDVTGCIVTAVPAIVFV